jgi:shikimate dehydrogenase
MKDVFKIFFNNEITVLKDLNTVSEKKQKSFDLIINCTTVGMDGKNFAKGLPIPEDWNLKDKFVFEMIYKPFDTELLLKAKSEKAVTINGIDMLVSQALDSFEIWTGVHPDKKDLLKYVTDTLSRQ